MLDQVDYQARSTPRHEVGERVQDTRTVACSREKLRPLNLISRSMFCLCSRYGFRRVAFLMQPARKMCSQLVSSDGCDNRSNFLCFAQRPAFLPDSSLEACET